MDEIDRKILLKLSDNARTPFKDIARDIGVSTDTVSKRYKKLKAKGIIQNVTVLVDFTKTNQGLIVCIGGKIEPGYTESVMKDLEQLNLVFQFGKSFGAYDFIMNVITKDLENVERVTEDISRFSHIKDLSVSIFTGPLFFYPTRQIQKLT